MTATAFERITAKLEKVKVTHGGMQARAKCPAHAGDSDTDDACGGQRLLFALAGVGQQLSRELDGLVDAVAITVPVDVKRLALGASKL